MRKYTVEFSVITNRADDPEAVRKPLEIQAVDVEICEGSYNFWIHGKKSEETVTVAHIPMSSVLAITSKSI